MPKYIPVLILWFVCVLAGKQGQVEGAASPAASDNWSRFKVLSFITLKNIFVR